MIELLIVVAIIGVLAAVGIPMYNGYIRDAKISATKENHARVRDQIAAVLTKCSMNSSQRVRLKNKAGTLINVSCGISTVDFTNRFTDHFSTLFSNPYGGGQAVDSCNHPAGSYGLTCLTGGTRNSPHDAPMQIITNHGWVPNDTLQPRHITSTVHRE